MQSCTYASKLCAKISFFFPCDQNISQNISFLTSALLIVQMNEITFLKIKLYLLHDTYT